MYFSRARIGVLRLNWKRGLFRVWVAGTVLFWLFCAYVLWVENGRLPPLFVFLVPFAVLLCVLAVWFSLKWVFSGFKNNSPGK